jgi:hypothetical protein
MYGPRYILQLFRSELLNSINSLDPDPQHYCELGSRYNIEMLYFRHVPDPQRFGKDQDPSFSVAFKMPNK